MLAALASLFTGRPVRRDLAMTGEITLRGQVLPVGGIKEKVLAAHRAGIRTVILPAWNRRELEDIPRNIQKVIRFRFVERMMDVLDTALEAKRRRSGYRKRRAPAARRKT
jgi:ATP-dependent Lon protease